MAGCRSASDTGVPIDHDYINPPRTREEAKKARIGGGWRGLDGLSGSDTRTHERNEEEYPEVNRDLLPEGSKVQAPFGTFSKDGKKNPLPDDKKRQMDWLWKVDHEVGRGAARSDSDMGKRQRAQRRSSAIRVTCHRAHRRDVANLVEEPYKGWNPKGGLVASALGFSAAVMFDSEEEAIDSLLGRSDDRRLTGVLDRLNHIQPRDKKRLDEADAIGCIRLGFQRLRERTLPHDNFNHEIRITSGGLEQELTV